MSFSTILFDLDGTLVDTETLAIEVVDRYYKDLGIEVSKEHLDYLVGRPWIIGMAYLQDFYPLRKSVKELETDVLMLYRKALRESIRTIPGAVEAVKSLSSSYRLGIVSGSRKEDIEAVVTKTKIKEHFEHLVGFEDYSEGKPSAAPYLKALSIFKVKPEDALVFEDSPVGIQSAVAAGLKVIRIGVDIPNFLGIDGNWIKKVRR